MAAVTMVSMWGAACVVVLSLAPAQLPAVSGSDHATTAATLPPAAAVRVDVGLSSSAPMTVSRLHAARLEDDRRAADDAETMDMVADSAVHGRRVVVLRMLQATTSPQYLGYGTLNGASAACGYSCVGRPGAPYLPASRPCAMYFQCRGP